LVVFSPKNLLRHPACKSYLWEFDDIPDDEGIKGVRFKRVITNDKGIIPKNRGPNPSEEPDFKRVVFCSGRYSLICTRKKKSWTEKTSPWCA